MQKFLSSLNSHHRILGGTAILAVTQLGASVAGLFRDRLLAQTFPDLAVIDAYIAAFRPSDLLFQACILSALGTVLVPVLASYKANHEEREMDNILTSALVVGSTIFGILALLLAILFPVLAPFMVRFQGETLRLYIQFGRLALLSNFLFVFGTTIGQYLVTVERYWIYGLTPILYTVGTIGGTVLLTPIIGPYGPMVGTLLGATLLVLLRIGAALRSGWHPTLTLWHPEIRTMGTLMIPRVLALGTFQLQILLLDTFASGLPQGGVTINTYTRNFQSVLVGIVGVAIAQSLYSRMSQAAAKKEYEEFFRSLSSGQFLVLLFTIPGSIALVLLAPLAAWLVDLSRVLPAFTICLAIYAVSIPFETLSHLQYRAFYALKNTWTPSTIGILAGGIAILTCWLTLGPLGIYGVALGYTVGEIVQAALLWWKLPQTTISHTA